MPQAVVKKGLSATKHTVPAVQLGKIDKHGNFKQRISLPPIKQLHYADWLHPHTMHRYVLLANPSASRKLQYVRALQIKPSSTNLQQNCDSCVYYHKHGNQLCGGNLGLTIASTQVQTTQQCLMQFRSRDVIAARLRDVEVLHSGTIVSLVQLLVQIV